MSIIIRVMYSLFPTAESRISARKDYGHFSMIMHMCMRVKVATYNVGCGGYFLNEESFINYITQLINKERIDIITIEESLMRDGNNKSFGDILAERTPLKYYIEFLLSPSHVKTTRYMGVTILSKYPIIHSESKFLDNPNIIAYGRDGKLLISHDKGFIVADIKIGIEHIKYIGGHFFPFYLFHVDECFYKEYYSSLETTINAFPKSLPVLIAADFNTDKLRDIIPTIFNSYNSVFHEATRPSGIMHDYILYNNHFSVSSSYILKDGLDHYCCVCEFEMVDDHI